MAVSRRREMKRREMKTKKKHHKLDFLFSPSRLNVTFRRITEKVYIEKKQKLEI